MPEFTALQVLCLLRAHHLGYEKSCAGAPKHKLKRKVSWLQKRVLFSPAAVGWCMDPGFPGLFAEVYDHVLVQNS